MNTIKNKVNTAILSLCFQLLGGKDKVQRKLTEKDGSFFTEHALVIVITVVIAAIIIMGVIALINNKIFPQLNSKIDEFFNLS